MTDMAAVAADAYSGSKSSSSLIMGLSAQCGFDFFFLFKNVLFTKKKVVFSHSTDR